MTKEENYASCLTLSRCHDLGWNELKCMHGTVFILNEMPVLKSEACFVR